MMYRLLDRRICRLGHLGAQAADSACQRLCWRGPPRKPCLQSLECSLRMDRSLVRGVPSCAGHQAHLTMSSLSLNCIKAS